MHTCTVSPRWAGHGLACGLGAEQATLGLPDRSSLCVNPSLTIAALAERASALLLRRGSELGLTPPPRVPPPGRTDAVRRRRCVHPV